jgi:hypothetical protein
MKACLALIPADSSAAELEPVLAQAKACNCDRTYITTTGALQETPTICLHSLPYLLI